MEVHLRAATDVQAVAMVQLDYGTDLDGDGRAARRTELSVTPDVLGGSSAGDEVSSLVLDVSYDDGWTWRRQDLEEAKGTWRTSLNAPSGAGYVSLRVTAEQRNGGGVTQTVVRAFGIR